MRWFDKCLYCKLRYMWDNKDKYNHHIEDDGSISLNKIGMQVCNSSGRRYKLERRLAYQC
jgi:hypothetical protein